MNLRRFLEWVEGEGDLLTVESAVEPNVEMARIIHAMEDRPILFNDPCRAGWRVASGVCAGRKHFAWALGTDSLGIVPRLVEALENPRQPAVIADAPCQQQVVRSPDLRGIPILKHLKDDGGPYVNSPDASLKGAERTRPGARRSRPDAIWRLPYAWVHPSTCF